MCEMIKDFERSERKRWEETALVCPAREGCHCKALAFKEFEVCEFISCWGRFCALQFGPRV